LKITIDIPTQTLKLYDNDRVLKSYSVSTAANGVGEQKDSEQTPRGKHIVRAKIGERASINTVFVGRRPTGEIYKKGMKKNHPDRDWILTRILWLSGLEPGKNRLGNVDTMQRYIYIHGTPDEVKMGQAGSRGCIRMRNSDLIELFDAVSTGSLVNICD